LGNIYYVNFLKETPIKIISSHKDTFINSISFDKIDKNILTCGDDGTIRAWTNDTFDQKYQFWKKNEICNLIIISAVGQRATILYNNNYLRIYNLASLKSLGKIKIPEYDINYAQYIFEDQGLLVSTSQDKVFVLDIQNWEPLSVMYSQLENDFMPKNQFFKNIDTKNIDSKNSLAVMSFSDGSCCVISIEKNQGKIDSAIIDKFNMFEYHISKSEDMLSAELYQNLTKFRVRINIKKKQEKINIRKNKYN
jgi:WD40 repeat protein